MVAMAVLVLIATAAGTMLIHSLSTTGDDRQRVRAANLAAQEIDIVRQEMQASPATIDLSLSKAVASSGTTFTVLRNGTWEAGDPVSTADDYDTLNLTVKVTWPNMGAIKPVVNSAVLTTLGSGGSGNAGQVVVLTQPTDTDPEATPLPTCPTGTTPVGLAVTTQVTVAGVTTVEALASGTVTANRVADGACEALIQTFPVVAGVAAGTLPYGDWTFTVTSPYPAVSLSGTWPSLTLNSPGTVNVALSIAGSCPSDSGLVALTVNTKTTVLGITTTLPLVSGTVTATRTANGACYPATTQTFGVLAGVAVGALPYGDWTFAVTTPSGSSSSTGSWPSATIDTALSVPVTLNIAGSCASNSGPVALTVNTKTTVAGVTTTTPLASGTVTATRTANGACFPATTQTLSVVAGVASGTLPYGDWTFAVTSPSGGSSYTGSWPSATIDSPASVPVTVSLLGTCAASGSGPVSLTVNTKATVYGVTTTTAVSSGTVTATRTANLPCFTATTQTLTVSGGTASGSLPYGDWTLSLNGSSAFTSWPAATINSSSNTPLTVSALLSCSTTPTTVNFNVQQKVLVNIPLVAGTLRATMASNGACQPAVSVTGLVAAGIAQLSLLPGTWTFSVDGYTFVSSVPASVTASGTTTAVTLVVK